MNISSIFDAYTIQARYFPAFILLLPWVLLFIGIGAEFSGMPAIISFTSISLSLLIAQHVRDSGKELETKLIKQWGGYPTTLQLLLTHTNLPSIELHAYRQKISNLYPDLVLPSLQKENEDPDASIKLINEAVRRIRESTRDTEQYHLLHQENIAYGFRRNLVSLKFYGVLSPEFNSLEQQYSIE